MTTAERAQLAADYLNARGRCRVAPSKGIWPQYNHQWRVDYGYGHMSYMTSMELIAIAERWQENETQNVPITGAETGQGDGGDAFDQTISKAPPKLTELAEQSWKELKEGTE